MSDAILTTTDRLTQDYTPFRALLARDGGTMVERGGNATRILVDGQVLDGPPLDQPYDLLDLAVSLAENDTPPDSIRQALRTASRLVNEGPREVFKFGEGGVDSAWFDPYTKVLYLTRKTGRELEFHLCGIATLGEAIVRVDRLLAKPGAEPWMVSIIVSCIRSHLGLARGPVFCAMQDKEAA